MPKKVELDKMLEKIQKLEDTIQKVKEKEQKLKEQKRKIVERIKKYKSVLSKEKRKRETSFLCALARTISKYGLIKEQDNKAFLYINIKDKKFLELLWKYKDVITLFEDYKIFRKFLEEIKEEKEIKEEEVQTSSPSND